MSGPTDPPRSAGPEYPYQPEAPTIQMPVIDAPAEPVRPPSPASDAQKSSALVAAGIFLSRVSGLVREVAIGKYLGTSIQADAFKAALRIPNMLQNLLGEGVLSASFIPTYVRLRNDGKEEEAGQLAGAIAGILLALTGVLSLFGLLLAEPITKLLVSGYSGDRFELTVQLTRIMFPGIGFLVLSAWCLGVLNSHRKFFLSYVAPVLWNAAQIVALVGVVVLTHETDHSMAVALAWGVLIGGAAQLAVQFGPTYRLLGQLRLSLDTRRRSVRHVLSRFVPVFMGRGVVQIMAYVDLWLASFLVAGAVSSMTYAQVLYLLPISLFGMSVAAAELPDLSQVEVYDPDSRRLFRRRLEEGMARIAFYVMPTTALFITVGDVIVRTTFQWGKFGSDDTWAVWLTLATFSFGLPATTGSRLLSNALFALDDAKTPARVAIIRVVVSAVVGLAFMFPMDRLFITGGGIQGWGDIWALGPLSEEFRNRAGTPAHLGVVALALGASVGAWLEYGMLARALAWKIGRTRMAGRWLNPIAAASAVAAIVGFAAVMVVGNTPQIICAALVLAPAGLIYLAMTHWLEVPEARSLVGRLRDLSSR